MKFESTYSTFLSKQCIHTKSFFNSLRPRQNGRHFADMFKCIFLNENVWILVEISLTFVPKGSIKNIPSLVQIMAWRRPGDKPLSEAMMVNLPTHICVSRPQWVTIMHLIMLSAKCQPSCLSVWCVKSPWSPSGLLRNWLPPATHFASRKIAS